MRPHTQPPATARPRVVLKFGGAGLAGGERVRRACRIVAQRRAVARPVVVVSAIGETTALIEAGLREAVRGSPDTTRVRLRHKRLLGELGLETGLCNRHLGELETLFAALDARRAPTPAERDHALSLGERMSARVLAAALRATGVEATPVDAWDLGLLSDSAHGSARPLASALREVGRALARVPGVPVVTGFVAVDARGRLTTLGRSGSDLTAALLAEACDARELELWKTVGGVMSVDPALVPEARTLHELSWSQAGALAFHGAGVLHPDALAPLERARIPARVLDLEHPDERGTRIGDTGGQPAAPALACRRGLALLRVVPAEGESARDCFARLGAALAAHAIEPRLLLAGPGELALLAPEGEALARLEATLVPRAPAEHGLGTLALVAPHDAAAAAAAGAAALQQAGLDVCLAWLDAPRGTALWCLPVSHLAAAATALHPLTCPQPHEPDPILRSTP